MPTAMRGDDRPCWGLNQVRTVKEIKLFEIYKRTWTFDSGSTHKQTIVILRKPYQNFEGQWRYKCALWPLKATSKDNLQTHLCSDSSIVPDSDKLWNLTTHLKKTGKKVKIGELIIASIKLVINKRFRFKSNQQM